MKQTFLNIVSWSNSGAEGRKYKILMDMKEDFLSTHSRNILGAEGRDSGIRRSG